MKFMLTQYNRCLLKGGKLSPDHYHAQDDPANKKQPISGKLTSKQLLSENNQLRIFFPRLGGVLKAGSSRVEPSQNGFTKQKRNIAPSNNKRKAEELFREIELEKQGD
ncbi:hypothetical protein OIU76_010156 [Salix suchowensis]|nr:hypothetical protein OIU76_010156 [Salix suchowensis]